MDPDSEKDPADLERPLNVFLGIAICGVLFGNIDIGLAAIGVVVLITIIMMIDFIIFGM